MARTGNYGTGGFNEWTPRQRRRAALKQRRDPAHQKQRKRLDREHAARMKRKWHDPKFRAKMLAARAHAWTPARKARHARTIKRKWQDPQYARAASAGLRRPKTAEHKQHIGDAHRGRKYPEISRRQLLSLAEVKQRIKRANPRITVRSTVYKGQLAPLKLHCRDCGTAWEESLSQLRYHIGHCPACQSLWHFGVEEGRVRKLIEKLTGWKFSKIRPTWLKGRSGKPLELDGYNARHKIAFEYQGRHHYQPVHGEEVLHRTKRRDMRKRVACLRHGVYLICVPYWKQDVERFLRHKLAQRPRA